jgi:hypothetical protein
MRSISTISARRSESGGHEQQRHQVVCLLVRTIVPDLLVDRAVSLTIV